MRWIYVDRKERLTGTITAIEATCDVEAALDVDAMEKHHLVRQSRGKLPGRRARTQQLRSVEQVVAKP